ncbi:MAG: hypothetical protein JXQ71_10705 [Verrucomicrobia bacterium]|nr:hypothetical protein [Verrucomicrobiota bacterium]
MPGAFSVSFPKLVCFALNGEAHPFRRRMAGRGDVRVLVTGMGAANAERELRRVLAPALPAVVFTCGLAGGLDPDLAAGDVLYEADAEGPCTAALRGAGARAARFHSARRVVVRASEKQALRAATGADAVEMESGVIRRVCREAGVTGVTVRAISDTAREDLPLDFNRVMTAGDRLDYVRLAAEVAAAPWRLGGLLALRRRSRRAARVLAEVLWQVIDCDWGAVGPGR